MNKEYKKVTHRGVEYELHSSRTHCDICQHKLFTSTQCVWIRYPGKDNAHAVLRKYCKNCKSEAIKIFGDYSKDSFQKLKLIKLNRRYVNKSWNEIEKFEDKEMLIKFFKVLKKMNTNTYYKKQINILFLDFFYKLNFEDAENIVAFMLIMKEQLLMDKLLKLFIRKEINKTKDQLKRAYFLQKKEDKK